MPEYCLACESIVYDPSQTWKIADKEAAGLRLHLFIFHVRQIPWPLKLMRLHFRASCTNMLACLQ